jgi:DNA-binding IclR family transcriptional regulator
MVRAAPSVDRVVTVLLLLSRHPDESFSLSEICRRLDMNVATAHALLNSLTATRFLLRHPTTKRYSLGPALVQVGAAASGGGVIAAIEHSRTETVHVAETLGRQCVASRVLGDEIVIVIKSGVVGPLGLTIDVGQRLRYTSPFGSVFAAWSDQAEIARWLERQQAELDPEALRRCLVALSVVRARGYAVGLISDPSLMNMIWNVPITPFDERITDQVFTEIERRDYYLTELRPSETYPVSNIAAPVIGPSGMVLLALAVPYFGEILSGADIESHAETIRDAANRVSQAIGGGRVLHPSD